MAVFYSINTASIFLSCSEKQIYFQSSNRGQKYTNIYVVIGVKAVFFSSTRNKKRFRGYCDWQLKKIRFCFIHRVWEERKKNSKIKAFKKRYQTHIDCFITANGHNWENKITFSLLILQTQNETKKWRLLVFFPSIKNAEVFLLVYSTLTEDIQLKKWWMNVKWINKVRGSTSPEILIELRYIVNQCVIDYKICIPKHIQSGIKCLLTERQADDILFSLKKK